MRKGSGPPSEPKPAGARAAGHPHGILRGQVWKPRSSKTRHGPKSCDRQATDEEEEQVRRRGCSQQNESSSGVQTAAHPAAGGHALATLREPTGETQRTRTVSRAPSWVSALRTWELYCSVAGAGLGHAGAPRSSAIPRH